MFRRNTRTLVSRSRLSITYIRLIYGCVNKCNGLFVTSRESENTANVDHILNVTELCTFEVTHSVHITNSVIEQVLTYMFVCLKTISKQINEELIAYIQRCTEAEIYVYIIASLTNIRAVWLKSVLFIRVNSAATSESQDQWLLQEPFRKNMFTPNWSIQDIWVFLRPFFKVTKNAYACILKWNRKMQYYLHETYKADLPLRYKINRNICFDVLARVSKNHQRTSNWLWRRNLRI